MWKPWQNLEGPAKVLVVLVTIFLVASGLCCVQAVIANSSGVESGIAQVLMPLGFLELLAILLSAAGIVIVLVIWGIRTVYRLLAGRGKDSA